MEELCQGTCTDEKEIEKVKLDWFTKDMIDNFFSGKKILR